MLFGLSFAAKLWYCNFSSQLSTALIIEGDYQNSLATLEQGYKCAAEMCYPELQVSAQLGDGYTTFSGLIQKCSVNIVIL